MVCKAAAARMTNEGKAFPLTMADILSTHGDFSSNTAVEITDDEGAPIGRGLIKLASADIDTRPRNLLSTQVMRSSDVIWTAKTD